MKRLLSMTMAVLLVLSLALTVVAYTPAQEQTADALKSLELFLGTDKGYELDNKLTRAQGITLLIRMMGKESEATANVLQTPFADVPSWAAGYIGYAYANSITKGISTTEFGSDSELRDYMFLTLILRALGYSDGGENAKFVWNDPYTLAAEVGLIDKAAADTELTRGDAVEILWNALSVKLNGQNTTLADALIAQGVFTKAEYNQAEKIGKYGMTQQPTSSESNGNNDDEKYTPSIPSKPESNQPDLPSQPEGGQIEDNETSRD